MNPWNGKGYTAREFLSMRAVFLTLPPSSVRAVVHELTPCQRINVETFYEGYRPTPRLCINFILDRDQLPLYRANRAYSAFGRSIDELLKAIEDADSLKLDMPHSIFLVTRRDGFESGRDNHEPTNAAKQ